MLSISKMKSGQQNYYTQLAREDYYLEGGEPPGQWIGEGAQHLSLFGQVKAELLGEVFRGELDGKALVQNAGSDKRTPGWDCTFSAPKSVSVVWSQADSAIGNEIRAAHAEAVNAALGYLEAEAGYTRRGKGGAELERCSLVMATYEHGTSRAQDPQLHTHALVMNLGVRSDGTTGTLDTRQLYIHKMAAGALYRAELSRQLEQRLGLKSVQDGTSFKLEGVSQGLADFFSKRRAEIERKLKKQGSSGAVASERAALTTRTNKEHRPRADLLPDWQQTGQEHGWSTEQLNALIREPQEQDPEQLVIKARLRALQAFEEVTERQTTFTEAQLTHAAAKLSQIEGIGLDGVLRAVEFMLKDPEIVRLGRVDGQERYTTQEILHLEANLLTRAKRMHGQGSSRAVEEQHQQAAIEQKGTLTDEQVGAVMYATRSAHRIALIEGDAGTGKTFTLDATRIAWEKSGHKVIGAALAGIAAEGLQDGAGIESRTIASLLMRVRWEKEEGYKYPNVKPLLDSNTVLVVDEAGMVDTRQMEELVRATSKAGAKLVLVGDPKQLQAIELGGAFAALAKKIGSYRMSEVMRQEDPEHAQAIGKLAEGAAAESLNYYAKNGLLFVAEDRYEAREQMLADWLEGGGDRNPDENLMMAGRRVDVAALNREAQEARLGIGRLHGAPLEYGKDSFFRGDRIAFLERDKKGLGVENGSRGTVTNIEGGKLTVKLDESKGVMQFSPDEYANFALGYAVTTHKAQGMTTENAYVLTDEIMQDRELSYVQISRAKQITRLYTTEEEAGEDLSQLTRSMGKSRQKELATVVQERADEEVAQRQKR